MALKKVICPKCIMPMFKNIEGNYRCPYCKGEISEKAIETGETNYGNSHHQTRI